VSSVSKSLIKAILVSICVFFACAQSVVLANQANNQQEVTQQLREIDGLLHAGHYNEGLLLAKKMKARYGEHPLFGWQLDGRLGLALILLEDYSASVNHLESAIRAQPEEPAFHKNLGSALMALGHRGRALSEFSQAVELDPGNYDYQLELGQLLLEFKNYPRARVHLEMAKDQCRNCVDVNRALGHLFMSSGEPMQAIPLFQYLLEKDASDSGQ